MFFSLIAVLLLPGLLAAYTIVLKSGQRIEAQGRYTIEGNVAKFTDASGRQRQVPLAEVDVTATERANAPAAPGAQAPSAAEARRKPKVWSNDDIELLVRGQKVSVMGEAAAEAAPGEEAAPATVAAEEAEATPAPLPPKEQTPEYWQERLKPLREELAKIDQELQALRSGEGRAASNAVTITASDLGPNVDDVIQQLERRRGETQQKIQGIQDEARRLGIPAGWVR
jgi:hypothetical protein